MYRVVDGVIVEREIPFIKFNDDGSQTVGYSLLPTNKLEEDGWVSVNRIIPEYDSKTHYTVVDKEEVKDGCVDVTYILKPIEISTNVIEKLQEENAQLFDTVKYLLGIKQ